VPAAEAQNLWAGTLGVARPELARPFGARLSGACVALTKSALMAGAVTVYAWYHPTAHREDPCALSVAVR
jgi:hypothetical protein